MGRAACGCDLAEKAEATADPRGAEVLRGDAAACQREWNCPRAGGHINPAALPPAQRQALDRVTRLVDANEGAILTCPGHYTRLPEAHRVVSLLRWFDKGQLHLREPHPSMALVEAIDLTEASIAARGRDDLERAKRKTPKGTDGR